MKLRLFVVISLILGIVMFTAAASPGNTVACPPPTPTNTDAPTSTTVPVPTPTNTEEPTATSIPPTPTNPPDPTATNVPPTQVPPICVPSDTGRVVNVLYMVDTSPLHYGYVDINGSYTGICRIETAAGEVPSKEFVQQYCTCDIPNFTWVTNRVATWKIVDNCNGTTALQAVDSSISAFMVDWQFGKYCPSTKCAAPK